MKSLAPFFIVIAVIFSVNVAAQGDRAIKFKNTQSVLDENRDDLAILYYHVEERINMNFGSSITTYTVSNLSLVNTRDLGENNTRKITPKYGKPKSKPREKEEYVAIEQAPLVQVKVTIDDIKPLQIEKLSQPTKLKYVEIDLIGTYERVLDKGYKSIDMLKRVGNSRFFGGDLEKAAKYYSQLFSMTTDLEAEYYYRYSQALFSIKENDKAKEMLQLFESKNL